MNFRTALFGALISCVVAGAPAFAHPVLIGHGNGHPTAVAVYCADDIEQFNEYNAFSSFVRTHSSIFYSGGVHDTEGGGEAESVGIGFRIDTSNANSFGFTSTSSGNGDPQVCYAYTTNGSDTQISNEGVSSINGRAGTRWSFNRAFSSVPRGARIFSIYFADFGSCCNSEDFTDTAVNANVNGIGVIPIGGLQQDCDLECEGECK